MNNNSSESISLQIDEIEKKIAQASETLNTIQEAKFKTQKELVELTEAVRKGKYLVSRLRQEKERLTRAYWRAKP